MNSKKNKCKINLFLIYGGWQEYLENIRGISSFNKSNVNQLKLFIWLSFWIGIDISPWKLDLSTRQILGNFKLVKILSFSRLKISLVNHSKWPYEILVGAFKVCITFLRLKIKKSPSQLAWNVRKEASHWIPNTISTSLMFRGGNRPGGLSGPTA